MSFGSDAYGLTVRSIRGCGGFAPHSHRFGCDKAELLCATAEQSASPSTNESNSQVRGALCLLMMTMFITQPSLPNTAVGFHSRSLPVDLLEHGNRLNLNK